MELHLLELREHGQRAFEGGKRLRRRALARHDALAGRSVGGHGGGFGERKTPKKFASTPRAVKFLLCKRKDQKIRPKSLQKPIKRLASGQGFNLWITKSRKTLIEY